MIDAGKSAEADAAFEWLLKEFPTSPKAADARYNLAVSAFSAKDFDRAIELVKPVIAEGSTAGPKLAMPGLMLLGRAQAAKSDWPAASSTFARLIADDAEGSHRREARFWKAEAEFKSGDAKNAEPEFRRPRRRAAGRFGLSRTGPDLPGPSGSSASPSSAGGDDTIAAADAFRTSDPTDSLAPEVEYARGAGPARASPGSTRLASRSTA